MKILFITHYDNLYGSSRSLLNLLDGLSNYGILPFIIFSKAGIIQQEFEGRGIIYKILPIIRWVTEKPVSIKLIKRFLSDLYRSLHAINKIVKEWRVDLVYSNSSIFPVGRIVSLLNGIPHIWHIREFGELDYSFKYILPAKVSRLFINNSTAVICNSQAIQDFHMDIRKKDRFHIIYNGVATRTQFDYFARQKASTNRNDLYTFLILGSISPKKGQESSIRAIARLQDRGIAARLIIAGSGKEQYMAYCKNIAIELGVSHIVEFPGYISFPYEVFFKSDCLLMCSDFEAMGRVTVEAMSACLPVIGKNSGGTPEIIEDEKTGLLYNTFDELVEAMIRMVENPEWGRHLGLAGWKRAKEKFNIEDYAANVYEVIQTVMKNK